MNFLGLTELFNNLIGVGKELIVDKDKQIEFAFKISEMHHQLLHALMTMNTTPKVDAFVKILYALKEVIIPMFRPVFSGLPWLALLISPEHVVNVITYIKTNLGPEYAGPIVTGLYGAFPAWMYSRHKEKSAKKEGS